MAMQGRISFWSAVLMSINIIVGVGIFFGPKGMAAAVGSMSFMAWPIVALLMFPLIWSIAQASRIFPGEGGFYNYCTQGINQTAGFIAQWVYLLGYMSTAATLTTLLRENLASQLSWSWITQNPNIFNAAAIIFFSLLNLMSIEMISKIQSIATLIKMIPLFFVIALLPFYWNPAITYNPADLANIGLAVPLAIFGYWGFEACCSLGHLLKDGPGQVGKVILTAFFISTALYTFFHLGVMHIMGLDALAAHGPIAFPQFMGLDQNIIAIITICISGSILLTFANSIFGVSLGNITNMCMIAQKRLIIGVDALTRTNRYGRPTVAAVVHGILLWIFLYFVTSSRVLVALTNIGVSTAFALTLLALILTYWKQQNYTQLAVTTLGLGSFGILTYFSLMDISPDPIARLMYLTPLFAGVAIGFVLFKAQQVQNKLNFN